MVMPKLVLVGDGGVGKTSLVVRYTQDQFTPSYNPTLEDNYVANIKLNDGSFIRLEVADTAGQEEYRALRDKYIVEGDVFLIVYSIIDSRSLQAAESLIEEIECLHEGTKVRFVLAANKCDLESERQVPKSDGEALAKKHGGYFIETSALNHTNIEATFQQLAMCTIENGEEQISCNCSVQ